MGAKKETKSKAFLTGLTKGLPAPVPMRQFIRQTFTRPLQTFPLDSESYWDEKFSKHIINAKNSFYLQNLRRWVSRSSQIGETVRANLLHNIEIKMKNFEK